MSSDPFYARLAELLPDVDIVVLPPEAPAEKTTPSTAAASSAAEAGATRALEALRRWWPVLLPDLPEPATIRRAWRPGADSCHVRASAEAQATIPDGRQRQLAGSRERGVGAGATLIVERKRAGLLRLYVGGVTIEVFAPPHVAWCSVAASVADIDVGELAAELVTTPPTETPWKQRTG